MLQWPITFEGLERGFLFYGTFADWLIGSGADGNILQCLFCVRSGPNGIVHNIRRTQPDCIRSGRLESQFALDV